MSLRETILAKYGAIADAWKVVKSLPERLEALENNLDAVRRAIDKDYDRTRRTQEACSGLAHKLGMQMFGVGADDTADGSVPANYDGLAPHLPQTGTDTHTDTRNRILKLIQQVQTKPHRGIVAPDGWVPDDDDED